jgi:hypothetical protein
LTNHQEQYFIELLKSLEVNGVRLTKPVIMQLASEYSQLVTGQVLNQSSFLSIMDISQQYYHFK